MADKKIVFLDIDGTFTVPLEKPTELALRAVREARKNGHRVLISTGRNMPIVSEDVLEAGFDGIVASAGRHIEIDGKVIRDSVLPEKTIQRCLEIFHQFGIYCRIESPEGIYIDGSLQKILMSAAAELSNSELIRMKKELDSDVGVKPYTEYPRRGAYKLGFICTDLSALEKTNRIWNRSSIMWCIRMQKMRTVITARSYKEIWIKEKPWNVSVNIMEQIWQIRLPSATV